MVEAQKTGSKLRHQDTGVEAIVVKSPSESELEIRAGGPVAVGKRYRCGVCPAEVIITKPGPGELVCHGATMTVAQPKALPASD